MIKTPRKIADVKLKSSSNNGIMTFTMEDGKEIKVPEVAIAGLLEIFDFGCRKYGELDWYYTTTNVLMTNHDSMFHHLAQSYNHMTQDHESKFHPVLHLACRAVMQFTVDHKQMNLGMEKIEEE